MKLLTEQTYRGLPLLPNQEYIACGYNPTILRHIYDMFVHVDKLKDFSPVFMRFDFPRTGTEERHISNFFKRLKKNHTASGMKVFYFYVIEQKKNTDEIHAHAFCIVDRRDYRFRRQVKAMLQKTWNHEKLKNPGLKNLFIPTAPPGRKPKDKGYNFRSLSTAANANTDIAEAFKAASYLAKTTQLPANLPKRMRRFRGSELPQLGPNDIRQGYDPESLQILADPHP